jgi:hypothetical protein
MGEVLAWYDMKSLIEAHTSDAEAAEMKRQQRRGRKKG